MYKYIVVSCDDTCVIRMVGYYDSLSEANAAMLDDIRCNFDFDTDIKSNAQLNEFNCYVFKSDNITVKFGDCWCHCKDGECLDSYEIFKIVI